MARLVVAKVTGVIDCLTYLLSNHDAFCPRSEVESLADVAISAESSEAETFSNGRKSKSNRRQCILSISAGNFLK